MTVWRLLRHCLQPVSCHKNSPLKYAQRYTCCASNVRIYSDNQSWSSNNVRQTFIDFYTSHGHEFVKSSSIIPTKGEGSYFINAGMNQFKHLIRGTVDTDSELGRLKRAVNSQKCIRVGGKHNDLDEVGTDNTHHTFFEMLGSWSFGDYFKHEACSMAWKLLTEVYKLPPDRLFVSYFGGDILDDNTILEPDLETRDIWINKIGVPPHRVLPFLKGDNFWEMGETGPCGPCTEIHYDHLGRGDSAAALVNSGDPSLVEIWNLVFMQYDRQEDGSLPVLSRRHVDTGMGLERITALLQGTMSNYQTDLFSTLLAAIHTEGNVHQYQGQVGAEHVVDTAYRLVADHARMIAVSVADGLLPGGKSDQDRKLRQIIHRCLQAGHKTLGMKPGFLSRLMPVVAVSLGDTYPELWSNLAHMCSVCEDAEQHFIESQPQASRILAQACNQYTSNNLTGDMIDAICSGRFGSTVSIDVLQLVAVEQGVHLDMEEYEKIEQSRSRGLQQKADVTQTISRLTENDILDLQRTLVSATEDQYKYHLPDHFNARVVALRNVSDGESAVSCCPAGVDVGVLLDRTTFYAKAGGQVADTGYITTEQGGVIAINDVQVYQGYVLHTGSVQEGSVSVGDDVTLTVHTPHREGCSAAHTATHIINYALNQSLLDVAQQGSLVTPHRLSFEFACGHQTVSNGDLETVNGIISDVLHRNLDVYTKEVPQQDALSVPGMRVLKDVTYPSTVRVVSIGEPFADLVHTDHTKLTSIELCGGTHVLNTRDIGGIVITDIRDIPERGTRKLLAVTGTLAEQAENNSLELRNKIAELEKYMSKNKKKNVENSSQVTNMTKEIDFILGQYVLSVIERNNAQEIYRKADPYKHFYLNEHAKHALSEEIKDYMMCSGPNESTIVRQINNECKWSKLIAVISDLKMDKPIMMFYKESESVIQAVCYIPPHLIDVLDPDDWARHVCVNMTQGKVVAIRGKYLKRAGPTARRITCLQDSHKDLQHAIELAQTYADLYLPPTNIAESICDIGIGKL